MAFIVLIAGPGVNGEEILELQGEKILRASGVADEVIRRNQERQRRLFTVVKSHGDSAAAALLRTELRAQFDTMSEAEKQALGIPAGALDSLIAVQVRQLNSPWFRFFLSYEPAASLERVTVPVLAIAGENDLQVRPEQNLPAIRAALARAGNRDVTVRALAGVNHLLQPSRTGAPAEYGTIEITMADEALETISGWILQRFRPRRDRPR